MNLHSVLQVGGTIEQGKYIYIVRREDDKLLRLLQEGEYVNVLTSRQMGKSSLMVRTFLTLREDGMRTIAIDLAAELGSESNSDRWFKGLVSKFADELNLDMDVAEWWERRRDNTATQKLQRFFREVVCAMIDVSTPIVVFLDEIDSTLRYPFTDGLFTAIRGMYNERSLVPAYGRVTFCLLGVATPNELIKDQRTTAYNIGRTLSLRDFSPRRDDLSPFVRVLSPDPHAGLALLERVLYWTGGQPYLTVKLISDLKAHDVSTPAAIDEYVERAFPNVEGLRGEIHIQQILRFTETRFAGLNSLEIYRRVLRGDLVRAETTRSHLELELSGLVRRDDAGHLALRNPIYGRIFDQKWLATKDAEQASHYQNTKTRGATLEISDSLFSRLRSFWKRTAAR
jgi:hypothetical protein